VFYVVLVTTKDQSEAKRIVEQLVSEKFVACANIVPSVSSTYWWKGKIEHADEALVVMKTSNEKLERLIARIKELHSYEVPEILALPIEHGLPEYLKWLKESLG
jgi:periplasmic divalent cation tolerance protein